jgi:hypothetical protein
MSSSSSTPPPCACDVLIIVPSAKDRTTLINGLSVNGQQHVDHKVDGAILTVFPAVGGRRCGVTVSQSADVRARMNKVAAVTKRTQCSCLLLIRPNYTNEDLKVRRVDVPSSCVTLFVNDLELLFDVFDQDFDGMRRNVLGDLFPTNTPMDIVEEEDGEVNNNAVSIRVEEDVDGMGGSIMRIMEPIIQFTTPVVNMPARRNSRRDPAPRRPSPPIRGSQPARVGPWRDIAERPHRLADNFVGGSDALQAAVARGDITPASLGAQIAADFGSRVRYEQPSPAWNRFPQLVDDDEDNSDDNGLDPPGVVVNPPAAAIPDNNVPARVGRSAALTAGDLRRYAQRRDSQRNEEQQLTRLSTQPATKAAISKPREEDTDIKAMALTAEDNSCMICMDCQITTVAMPCRRYLFCHACITKWLETSKRCPQCNTEVVATVQIITKVNMQDEHRKRKRHPDNPDRDAAAVAHCQTVAKLLRAEADALDAPNDEDRKKK